MNKSYKTQILTPVMDNLIKGAKLIKEGGVIGIPTETVYGLAANGLNQDAVLSIFMAKGRPADNPLILHIASPRELNALVLNISNISKK